MSHISWRTFVEISVLDFQEKPKFPCSLLDFHLHFKGNILCTPDDQPAVWPNVWHPLKLWSFGKPLSVPTGLKTWFNEVSVEELEWLAHSSDLNPIKLLRTNCIINCEAGLTSQIFFWLNEQNSHRHNPKSHGNPSQKIEGSRSHKVEFHFNAHGLVLGCPISLIVMVRCPHKVTGIIRNTTGMGPPEGVEITHVSRWVVNEAKKQQGYP